MTTRTLIKGGTVLSMDPVVGDARPADVLVEDSTIVAVAADIDDSGCQVIDACEMVVMPGLIDPHRHLWYQGFRGCATDATMVDMIGGLWPRLAAHMTARDLYQFTRAGIVDALDNGITTVFDWCHAINTPEHAHEAIRAHLELPMRAVFGVGGSMSRKLAEFEGRVEHTDSWDVAREVRNGQLSNHPRVGMALAVQGIEYSSLAVTAYDVAAARELGVPISMHIAVQDGAPVAHGISQLDKAGLLGGDMQFVHCITTTDDEFRRLAELDARAACTPICELMIGFGLPPTDRMRRAGMAPAFGADAVCTASGDLFDEARTALIAERLNHAQRRFPEGTVDTLAHLGLTAREAIQGITTNAARACWLENRTGSLTPGKAADIILLRATDLGLAPLTNALGSVLSGAHGSNVDTVIVDGRIVKSGGELVGVDRRQVYADLIAASERVFAIEFEEGYIPARGARSDESIDERRRTAINYDRDRSNGLST